MKLLVFVGNGIGNCITTTPLIVSLKEMRHDVDVIVRSYNTLAHELFYGLCNVYSPSDPIVESDYDYGIITWGMDITPNASRVKVLRIPLPVAEEVGEVEYNMTYARFLGYKGPTPPLYSPFKQTGSQKKDIIVVNRLSKDEFKRWDNWKWDELIMELNNKFDYEVIVIDRKFDSLFTVMKYIQRAVFTVTSEGGFGWMSLAAGAKTVILAGVTIGGSWGGRYYGKKNVYNSPNAIYIVKDDIKQITVKETLDKIFELASRMSNEKV